MNRVVILLACIFSVLLLLGCNQFFAGFMNQTVSMEDEYRQRAADHENRGELQQALLAWRIVAHLNPDDASIPKTIHMLETTIDTETERHFKRGLEKYQIGAFSDARREFLISLRLSPEHHMARYYLKKRLNSVDLVEYKVQRGDSYTKIATDTYQDPSKAYSIAYYNDFDPRKPLLTETLLRLPELPQQYLLPRKDISTLEEQAQKAIDEKKFLNAIKIIEKIREEQPGNPRINALSDTAFYNQGMVLLKENNYTAALKYLDKVNPKFKGRKKAVRLAQYHIEQQALDAKLKEAHKLMEKGDYPATITIAEDILSQVPDNQPAKTLSNAARYAWAKLLLEKGKESQAIALLEPIEKGYKDTADLLMQARGKLNAHAEAYYRTGVKYFLNEELELAVEAWEKALALNPAHPKAKTDMENARRLLEKWRGFSQDPSSQSTKQPQ